MRFKRYPLRTTWGVTVEYAGGLDAAPDKRLFKAAATVLGGRGRSDASGAWIGGDRDHRWETRVHDGVTATRLAKALLTVFIGDSISRNPRVTLEPPPREISGRPRRHAE